MRYIKDAVCSDCKRMFVHGAVYEHTEHKFIMRKHPNERLVNISDSLEDWEKWFNAEIHMSCAGSFQEPDSIKDIGGL